MEKKLFLLDAMALIFRAYYALIKSPRITSKGLNTSAILGFTNTLYEIIVQEKPTHIAVSFDTGSPTLRHADFSAYKANREATPNEIIESIPYIKKIITAFNIPILELDGYEADDIIGTVSKKAEIEGFSVFMMTSDKDYGQLVSDNIKMYKPAKSGQKAEIAGVKEICEKYSIANPEQLIDILGLWGDASDNIPGVPTIGEVKAKKLIEEFGSIENIYKNINSISNIKLRDALIENQDQAIMSKMLATIILDVPIDIDFNKMLYTGPNEIELKNIFKELEFSALSKRIFSSSSNNISYSSGELFSTDNSQQDVYLSSFTKFENREHNFEEIFLLDKYLQIVKEEKKEIFFDWIISNNGEVAGFVFSIDREEKIYYLLMNKMGDNEINNIICLLQNASISVTYQAKSSYKFLKKAGLNDINISFFDIQIAHYLIQPEISHQIERISENYLNYSLINSDTDNYMQKKIKHSVERVEIYKLLYPIFKQKLESDKLINLFYKIEMPLVEVLSDMEVAGICLDTEILNQNSKNICNSIKHLEEDIFKLAGVIFNLGSPKQLGEVIFDKLQIIENAKLTKTKQYQTGEEILSKLAGKHPIIPLILEWRTLSKLKFTYIDALPDLATDGRIHTTFNQTVTSTGRLSSTNPNLQNIPIRTEQGKDIRKAFVASDSTSVILAADYSQIELRLVAAICGDEEMKRSFINNEDIHTAMAAKIYHISIEEVTPEMRRNAKMVNFGILYGISAFGLSDRLHIPQKEARELIESYFVHFPKINLFLENTISFAKKNGYVETLFGRRRYIKDINSSNAILRKAAERNTINAPIQGSAADLIKIAMINIYKAFQSEKLKSKMLLQVHDELVFEVKKEELEVVEEIVRELMVNAMELPIPLVVDIKWGHSWYDAH